MFALLLGGVYSAYKHFSGLDPLKLDPQSLLKTAVNAKTPQQLLTALSSVKLTTGVSRQVLGQSALENLTKSPTSPTSGGSAFKFLLVADSHNDNVNLKKAIAETKQTHPDLAFIIGLGDYTDVGTVDELRSAKKEFDFGALRYFLLAGDHDLWDSRNRSLPPTADFNEVFGLTFQSFMFENFKFLILDNSDDYKGLGDEQLKWVTAELEKAKTEGVKGIFVFVHEPLFHPSSDHVMGKVEKDLKLQAKSLIRQLADVGVKKVFAGDIHYFSEYSEPETNLSMVTVGAITSERNPQSPRFAVVSVYQDGSTKVEDVEIK